MSPHNSPQKTARLRQPSVPLWSQPRRGMLLLTVCAHDWQEAPTERTFEVEFPVPATWDAAALEQLIAHVYQTAADGVSSNPERRAFGCFLRHGYGGGLFDRTRYPTTLFLIFNGAREQYAVALPEFPAPAIVELLQRQAATLNAHFYLSLERFPPERLQTWQEGPATRLRKRGPQ